MPVVRRSLLFSAVRPSSSRGGFCHFEVRGVVFVLVLQNIGQKATVMALAVMTATPLKLNGLNS